MAIASKYANRKDITKRTKDVSGRGVMVATVNKPLSRYASWDKIDAYYAGRFGPVCQGRRAISLIYKTNGTLPERGRSACVQ